MHFDLKILNIIQDFNPILMSDILMKFKLPQEYEREIL